MIFIVLMKELAYEIVTPVAAFNDYAAAKEWMNRAIETDGYAAGFKIDTVQLNPTVIDY